MSTRTGRPAATSVSSARSGKRFPISLGRLLPFLAPAPLVGGQAVMEGVMMRNGDVYACDHFVYPPYRIGNIAETPLRDLVWSEKARAFGQEKAESLTAECRKCPFLFACQGGCPKHRFLGSGDGPKNHLCEAYRMFFHHAGPRMRMLTAMHRSRS